eukprot:6208884-Pleurochrysis_carterae.AAC.2
MEDKPYIRRSSSDSMQVQPQVVKRASATGDTAIRAGERKRILSEAPGKGQPVQAIRFFKKSPIKYRMENVQGANIVKPSKGKARDAGRACCQVAGCLHP